MEEILDYAKNAKFMSEWSINPIGEDPRNKLAQMIDGNFDYRRYIELTVNGTNNQGYEKGDRILMNADYVVIIERHVPETNNEFHLLVNLYKRLVIHLHLCDDYAMSNIFVVDNENIRKRMVERKTGSLKRWLDICKNYIFPEFSHQLFLDIQFVYEIDASMIHNISTQIQNQITFHYKKDRENFKQYFMKNIENATPEALNYIIAYEMDKYLAHGYLLIVVALFEVLASKLNKSVGEIHFDRYTNSNELLTENIKLDLRLDDMRVEVEKLKTELSKATEMKQKVKERLTQFSNAEKEKALEFKGFVSKEIESLFVPPNDMYKDKTIIPNKELTQLRTTMTKQQEQLQRLEAQLAQEQESQSKLQALQSKTATQKQELEARLAQEQELQSKLQSQMKSQGQEFQKQKEELRAKIAEEQKQNVQIQQLNTNLQELQSQIKKQGQEFEKQKRELATKQGELEKLKDQLAKNKEEEQKQKNQIADSNANIQKLQSQIETQGQELATKQRKLQELEAKLAKLQTAHDAKDIQIAESKDNIQSLQSQIEKQGKLLGKKEEELASKQQQLEQGQANFERLNDLKDKQIQEISSQKRIVAEEQKKFQALNQKFQEQQKELQALQVKQHESNTSLQSLKEEQQRLQLSKSEVQKRYEALLQQIKVFGQKAQEKSSEWKENGKELKKTLNELMQPINSGELQSVLQGKKVINTTEYNALQARLEQLTQQETELQLSLQSQQQRLEQETEKYQEQQQELEGLRQLSQSQVEAYRKLEITSKQHETAKIMQESINSHQSETLKKRNEDLSCLRLKDQDQFRELERLRQTIAGLTSQNSKLATFVENLAARVAQVQDEKKICVGKNFAYRFLVIHLKKKLTDQLQAENSKESSVITQDALERISRVNIPSTFAKINRLLKTNNNLTLKEKLKIVYALFRNSSRSKTTRLTYESPALPIAYTTLFSISLFGYFMS
jgi:chromosome segregation ATPase